MVMPVPSVDRLRRQGRSKEREAAMEKTLTSLVRRNLFVSSRLKGGSLRDDCKG